MTDAQNGSGGDTEGNGSNPEVVRMWQKLYQMPGGKKDPFEETIARMPDGTVYAGISPATNEPMYATPNDAPLTYTFNQAQKYAAKLDAHGHHDWRVPTKGELNVLFQNRAAIGGFDESGSDPAGWYWSSSQDSNKNTWAQRFSDGYQNDYLKTFDSSLRLVR